MVRADLYHKYGGLDHDLYAHMEEVDLCWRLKNAGYKIGYIAGSTVYHVGGSVISYGSPQKLFYNFQEQPDTAVEKRENQSVVMAISATVYARRRGRTQALTYG